MVTYAPRDEPNPWSEADGTWNLTDQAKFIKRMVAQHGAKHGMERVKQFAAQSGVTVDDNGVVVRRAPIGGSGGGTGGTGASGRARLRSTNPK